MNNNDNTKRVKLDLTEVDGNAFALMGAFRAQARIEQWDEDDIREVLNDAMSSDYDHLVSVLVRHTYMS